MRERLRAWRHRLWLLATPPRRLEAAEIMVAQAWPGVRHMTAEEAARRIAEPSVLLVDARGAAEYRVSRLPNAVHLTSATALAQHVGAQPPGTFRLVLVYCAIGARSSHLAERVMRRPDWPGDVEVANLVGGIFGWHRAGRPLVGEQGVATTVHPFSRRWAHLVER